jgi:environmental stress-induced protein Ves
MPKQEHAMPHRFDLGAIVPMPWKNGGGSTRELACWPPGAGMSDFDWRISVATIAAPGPFSAFPGIDRTIMLLDGSGVRLRSRDGDIDHRLDTALMPFKFSGDAQLDCELLGATSTDFNVMVRRDRLNAVLDIHRGSNSQGEGEGEVVLPTTPHGLLLALRGTWTVQTSSKQLSLAPSQGIWWADTPIAGRLRHDGTSGACMLSVRIDT